ncbi:unnamed protein product [Parnassius apollo]|uniref:DNA ligase 4 n=1 Tax=Parnassius apollo TaxID=110799 RepID=A0A8S3WRY5_PARAO|nr:unnamed protein product [Parnassius apollo]
MSSSEIVVPANQVLFEEFCTLLDSLYDKKKTKREKFRILSNYVDDFRLKAAHIRQEKNSTFYPILRLLLPALERERSSYNLKEARLGALFVNTLAWNKNSPNSQKLLNYRSNSHHKDFATVAYDLLKDRVCKSSSLTIGNVNDILDQIANAEAGKSPTLEEIFTYILNKINGRQLKWFIRIILKDLKLNMGLKRIFAAFHPDAKIYYDNCSDLSKVCANFDGGNTRPSEIGVEIFYAVSPMLLEQLKITKLSDLPPTKTYMIEEKFDGERFQIHMENNIFEYFSRKGHKYSHNFGESYESGSLTPLLKDCFAPTVKSFILDGEMMGWHKEQEAFGSKGMKYDVKTLKDKSQYQPSFCAYDILYYNGKSLVGPSEMGGLPLIKRLEILDNLFRDVPGVISHSQRQVVKDNSDIVDALNKSIEDNKEGITVKDIESYYIANRRDAGWYKIKPEYTEDAIEDLDLVIIGKTLRHPKSFYVACVDNTGGAPRWLCVCGVTGLGREARGALCERLAPHWRRAAADPPPPCLHFNKQKPDFWLPPEHSVVLQVRASELVCSNSYGTPYTLRFQRIIKVRYDKPVNDIMTLQQFEKIVSCNKEVVKLSKKINQEQIDNVSMIPRKKRVSKPLKVAEQFRTQISGEVTVKSQALLGRKICILSDDVDCDKAELVKIIKSHGGKHEENYGADTWCCVAGRLIDHVRFLINKKIVNIVSTSWLRSLPESDALCSLSPLDMLAITKEMRLKMSLDYDYFGDSYKNPIEVDTLKKCFDKMDSDEPKVYLTTQEKIKLDKELFEENNPFSYLRPCFLSLPWSNRIYAIRAQMYGATICDLDSGNVTHVVVPKSASSRDKEEAKKLNALLVSEEWLDACFAEGRLTSEASFVLS